MNKKVFLTLFALLTSVVLVACTGSKIKEDNPSKPTEVESSAPIKLEVDPSELCNALSPEGKVLVNFPCENQTIKLDDLNVQGKVIGVDPDVDIYILQDGSPVYSTSLTTIPTDAAGDYKLLQGPIRLNTDLSGDVVLRILQGNEQVEIPITIEKDTASQEE
jgi:hypothetical protein